MGSEATQFKPGQSGNPAGRQVGSRNKLTTDFVTALAKDFAEHGVAAIQRAREDDPASYLRLIASLAPKELAVTKENPFDQFSDEEIAALLAAASGVVAAETEDGAEGEEEADGAGKTSRLH